MNVHGNAKLGPAGRRSLVGAVAERARRCGRRRPCLAFRRRRRIVGGRGGGRRASRSEARSPAWLTVRVGRGAFRACLSAARAAADLRGPAPHRVGAAVDRRPGGTAPLDRVEGASAHGLSRRRRADRGIGGSALRVALPWRPLAHGYEAVRTVSTSRPRRHRRSRLAPALIENARGEGYEYAQTIVDDHSRLAYTELHATSGPTPAPGSSPAPLPGRRSSASSRASIDDRQRLGVHQEPVTRPSARTNTACGTCSSAPSTPRRSMARSSAFT